ncbi:hypothetical protein FFWV33_08720 [Flavobacterium faecale]|uniref:Uncharacterized protein n=1 Tax=Flavobacterium faecale TaxID=1355330 RepID=A0A2S1LCX6_9FLAO|nr:hypothetical protein [Flavobacterium faecale]AWG21610.1 hypothetical protein FFWV33_08720 [Flavobacterium faecale]
MNRNTNHKRAIIGGVISLAIMLLGSLVLGKLSGYEAKVLIQKSLSGVNTLCNTIALASATILALLLTVLGISSNSRAKLKRDHYFHVLAIAKWDTAVFIASIVSFMLLNLPITETDAVPTYWYNYLYYTSLTISSILTSGLIVVVLMLYNTIVNMIEIVGLENHDHPLAVDKKEEK